MAEAFLGEIRMVGFGFAPTQWQPCNGQMLAISQFTALFSLLGTTYGGNGTTTFGLPDLRGRVPIHQGTGVGLSPYVMGQNGGNENVTLLSNQMPQHNHSVVAVDANASTGTPQNNLLAKGSFYGPAPSSGTMNGSMIGMAGGNLPHNNIQPYLCVNFVIAMFGIFPSRN